MAAITRTGKFRLPTATPYPEMSSMAKLQGVFVPNIAPYRADGSLHEEELRRMVDWFIEKGISGLYPNGSTGEFIRLGMEERKRTVAIMADQARGRLPILAGAAESNTDRVLEMCRHCADHGCDAVSITGPYYYQPNQESVEAWFRHLAAESPIDIVLYNIPAFCTEISLPVLTRLALDCPRIIGIKDSSGDMARYLRTINDIKPQRPDFSILAGWDPLLVPFVFMGGDGGTLATSGIAPEALMRMYGLCRSGDWAEARRLQYQVIELFDLMLGTGNFPTGFRLAYEVRGFDIGPARFPESADDEALFPRIRQQIACLLDSSGFASDAQRCTLSDYKPRRTFDDQRVNVDSIVDEVLRRMRSS